jgi:Ca2+:H+ antiporter
VSLFPKPSLSWLLVFVPVTIALEYLSVESHTLIFLSSCVAIIPLAGLMGKATEHVAERTGEAIGGLLNATFGNAAELIIALMALREGLHEVVKASLTGSIIGNILLVLGASFLAGGLRYKVQRFNASGARIQSTMLTLAAIALILPAAYHFLGGQEAIAREADLSLEIAAVLIITYGLSLVFSLHTHKQLFLPEAGGEIEESTTHRRPWSLSRSLIVLGVATLLVAWMSEVLVGSVVYAAQSLGMTSVFIGIIVVAIIGNAAEHTTAVIAAIKNRMDLSIGIAVGSSIQVALFVAPVLVFASYFIGPAPMNLVFTPAEVIAIALAVLITGEIAGDGESNWLEGVQLLSVYIILGIVFYFLPEVMQSLVPKP